MNQATAVRDMKAAMEAVETSLATPVLPGDLPAWIGYVQSNWNDLLPLIQQQLDDQHRAELKQIGKEDPELLPQVEKLKIEDDAIREQVKNLTAMITRLETNAASHDASVDPHESKAQENLADTLVAEGLAFVTRIRKQDVAVQTWVAEAFNRERGAGD